MDSSTRIILNTAVTYGHSIFAIIVSLFSTRWILQALGESDYGLFGVVGSLIVMITFLNGGLQVGVSRFYAYAIGEGENESIANSTDRLMRWFNTAFSIHLFLPLALLLIGWIIGEFAIENWLTIPEKRLDVSIQVFRVSLLTAFTAIFSVPFISLFAAHQIMIELAIFGVLRTSAVLILAWCLLCVSSDRLLVYAYAMAGINVGLLIVQIIRSAVRFPCCRIRMAYMYQPSYLKQLFGFVGWKMFGMSCVTFRAQGTPMLVNMQFGPIVNAAYSVAFGLSSQATSLSQALTGAFRPAVMKAEGKGDREGMLALAFQSCKFGSLLVILFAIPLIIEMHTVLELWLGDPPKYTEIICQWLLAMLIVDRMTTGQMLAVNANGKIAFYEIVQGLTLVTALPLMWLFFRFDLGPFSIGLALFFTMLCYCVGRVLFAKYLLQFPIMIWLKTIALPVLALVLVSGFSGWVGSEVGLEGFRRVILTTTVCASVTLIFTWFVLLDTLDRGFVLDVINKIRKQTVSKFAE